MTPESAKLNFVSNICTYRLEILSHFLLPTASTNFAKGSSTLSLWKSRQYLTAYYSYKSLFCYRFCLARLFRRFCEGWSNLIFLDILNLKNYETSSMMITSMISMITDSKCLTNPLPQFRKK